MYIIVGLGNPGKEYMETRHNVGWMMLGSFVEAKRLPSLVQSAKYSAQISAGVVDGNEVLIVLPQTYMNRSGIAVQKALTIEQEKPEHVVVVYDDIDLPLGEIKVSSGRGAGGHNGVQSIIDTLGTKEFVRVRVGIGEKGIIPMLRRPRGEALSKYVLGEFTKDERAILDTVDEKVVGALTSILIHGVAPAMNAWN